MKSQLSRSLAALCPKTYCQLYFCCIPFCIPDGLSIAENIQPEPKSETFGSRALRGKSATVTDGKRELKMGFWIFSPLLYQLSYPAKLNILTCKCLICKHFHKY
jgi:hypothetical protein